MHVKQWLMIGTLTGGALLGSAWLGPAAQADGGGGGSAQINENTIITTVTISQSPTPGSGFRKIEASGWTPPACWLEPWPGGFGVSPGYTPSEFAAFMTQLDGYAGTQSSPGNIDGGADQWEALYRDGQGDDPIVHLINAPYNSVQSGGKWDGVACSNSDFYSDRAALMNDLGVTNPYEDWFWIKDGNPPAGVPTVTAELLAEYAASEAVAPTDWPAASPPFTVNQTVNLPTKLTSAADYQQFTVTAKLQDIGLSSTVTVSPLSISITAPAGVLDPDDGTCDFDGGSLGGCRLDFIKASNGGQFDLTGTITWQVVWGGAGGEAGWTRNVTVPLTAPRPVTVQEIQTIVNGGA